jgi:uncharacterized membrane protein
MDNKKQKQYNKERWQVFIGGLVIGGILGFLSGAVVIMSIAVK